VQGGQGRLLLAAYALASIAYGWFVLLAILWLIRRGLRAHRLDVLGSLLTAVVLAGVLAPVGWRAVRFVQAHGRMRQAKRSRAALSLLVLGMLLAALCLVPLPQQVSTEVVLRPRDAQTVYVTVPGILESVTARPGERVAAGQTLAQLTNREVDLDVAKLEGQLGLQQTQVRNLHRQRVNNPAAGSQIPQAEEALRQLDEQLRQRREDQGRLTIVAPVAGTVMPPPPGSDIDQAPNGQDRDPSPLERAALGSLLKVGATFCLIGDLNRWEAVLAITQEDIDLVKPGQAVAMQFDELPGVTFTGEVIEMAEIDVDLGPRGNRLVETDGLPQLGKLQTELDPSLAADSATLYRARVSFDAGSHRLLQGFQGRAKVKVDPQPLATRALRALRQTFGRG
jgi:putative peptide zinc metalloprotease protein